MLIKGVGGKLNFAQVKNKVKFFFINVKLELILFFFTIIKKKIVYNI